jgi:hypothetical protein
MTQGHTDSNKAKAVKVSKRYFSVNVVFGTCAAWRHILTNVAPHTTKSYISPWLLTYICRRLGTEIKGDQKCHHFGQLFCTKMSRNNLVMDSQICNKFVTFPIIFANKNWLCWAKLNHRMLLSYTPKFGNDCKQASLFYKKTNIFI